MGGQVAPQTDNGANKSPGEQPDAEQLRSPTGPAASMLHMPAVELQHLQSPWVFRGCWVAVLVMHAIIGLAYLAMAGLFAYIRANVNVLEAMAYLGDSLIDYFNGVIVVGGIHALLHALAILYVLFWSMRYRVLLLARPELNTPVSPLQQQQAPQKSAPSRQARCWTRFRARRNAPPPPDDEADTADIATTAETDASPPKQTKWWRVALCGLRSHDLELLVDIGLQTFQAEKISRLIARVWINRLMAVVIVCNCWFAPLVRLVFRNYQRATIDIIQLVVDSILDIVYSIAVPTAILLPYYYEFDTEGQTFPFINYYKDAWYINAVAENRQFFITSWVDFVAKMLPGASLLLRLHQIKRILMTHKQFGIQTHKKQKKQKQKQKIQPMEQPTSATNANAAVNSDASTVTRFRDKTAKAKRKIVARALFTIVLLSWGVVVLIVHLHATTIAYFGSDAGCLLELRPWSARQYVCVVLEVSCTQRRIDDGGGSATLDAVVASVDVSSIQGLVFAHCAALHVPPTLQRAHNLQLLKVYNSTIVAWHDDAALTALAHPHLQLVYVTRTSFAGGTLPVGLLASDFPPSLYDIEFCSTDLTSLPDDLDTKWTNIQYLGIELSASLTAAPPVLARMPQTTWLSLSGNAIRTIPDALFRDASFFNLMLMGNPLESLPLTFGDVTQTTVIMIANSNVSELPPVLLASDGVDVPLYASNTPLCESWLSSASERDDGGGGTTEFTAGPFRVYCDSGYAMTHAYPLEAEDDWRQKNRV